MSCVIVDELTELSDEEYKALIERFCNLDLRERGFKSLNLFKPVTITNADPTLTVFHSSAHEDGDDVSA